MGGAKMRNKLLTFGIILVVSLIALQVVKAEVTYYVNSGSSDNSQIVDTTSTYYDSSLLMHGDKPVVVIHTTIEDRGPRYDWYHGFGYDWFHRTSGYCYGEDSGVCYKPRNYDYSDRSYRHSRHHSGFWRWIDGRWDDGYCDRDKDDYCDYDDD